MASLISLIPEAENLLTLEPEEIAGIILIHLRSFNDDTAVFQTFKEVEIAVRNFCGYNPEDIGVSLMRKAFAVNNGPL